MPRRSGSPRLGKAQKQPGKSNGLAGLFLWQGRELASNAGQGAVPYGYWLLMAGSRGSGAGTYASMMIRFLGLWARSSTPSSLMMTQSSMRTPNLPGR